MLIAVYILHSTSLHVARCLKAGALLLVLLQGGNTQVWIHESGPRLSQVHARLVPLMLFCVPAWTF